MNRRVQGSLRGTQKIPREPSSAHSTKTRRSSSHLHGNNTRGRQFCSHERGSHNSVSNLLREQHFQECRNKILKVGEGRLHSPSRCTKAPTLLPSPHYSGDDRHPPRQILH